MSDDAQGLPAQLSYYFFLSLFPALLCVITITSFFPLQNLTDDMVRLLGPFAPAEMLELLKQQMVKIGEGRNGGLLSVGLFAAMNRAYDRKESDWRPRIGTTRKAAHTPWLNRRFGRRRRLRCPRMNRRRSWKDSRLTPRSS